MDIRKEKSHTFHVLRRKSVMMLCFYIVFGISGLVLALLNLLELKAVPKPILAYTTHFLVFSAAGFTAAYIYYLVKRFRIVITKDQKRTILEIFDPTLTETISVESPFTIYRQWSEYQPGGGEQKIRIFCITICNSKDEPFITLEGGIGKWNDTPAEFTYVNYPGGFRKGSYIYEARKIILLSELLKH